jgi:hypothetical protein
LSRRVADRYWWSVALNVLEQAEYRSVEIAELVQRRIYANQPDDREALRRLYGSMLGRTAAAHGWAPAPR